MKDTIQSAGWQNSFVSKLPGGGLGRRISSLRSDIRWPSPGGVLTTATAGDLRSAACFCILTPLESKLSRVRIQKQPVAVRPAVGLWR